MFGLPVAANSANAVFEYDPNLDITWLRDWNVLEGQGVGLGGRVPWSYASDWAASLTFSYIGGDWRLPKLLPPKGVTWCFGVNYCTDSELGYLYHIELGNSDCLLFPCTEPRNVGPFLNMEVGTPVYPYWMRDQLTSDSRWVYYYQDGNQVAEVIERGNYIAWGYAVAVHDGDVYYYRPSHAPEPGTLALLGIGLAGLVTTRRRKQ